MSGAGEHPLLLTPQDRGSRVDQVRYDRVCRGERETWKRDDSPLRHRVIMRAHAESPSMADLAVVHPDLSMQGGAENVCMHTLEAIQSRHDVTLLTLTRPDLEALNRFFETSVDPLRIRLVGQAAPVLRHWAGHRAGRLQAALLGRAIRRKTLSVDAFVSTKNEFGFDTPSVQYVHSPQFAATDPGLDSQGRVARAYERTCARLAHVNPSSLASARLLANSEWTAGVLEDAYGIEAHTVYPPVAVERFSPRPWADREQGFLTVGRIGPSKRILRNVEVIDRLRDRGHDVHLHIVGPTTDGAYGQRVERVASRRDFVSLEGPLGRNELVELIETHRYGLHGRPYEHFGMAVAEFAASGTIPFAPDSGGQVEILEGESRLLYESVPEAVEKIDRVLSDPSCQDDLQARVQAATSELGCERFASELSAAIDEVLP